jgi:hypothetical protein
MDEILLTIGAVVITFWGFAHLIPTKAVVAGFEPLSTDNRRIITMEWATEGLALIFIGLLVLLLTLSGEADDSVAVAVYRFSALGLVTLAVLSAFTGARTSILPMRLCPVIKTSAAALIVLGTLV